MTLENFEVPTPEYKEIPVTIEPATTADFNGVRDAHYRSWLATYPNKEIGVTKEDVHVRFKDRLSDSGKKRFGEVLNDKNNLYLVAKISGSVIGFAVFKKEPERNFLDALYVVPEYFGRKIGYQLWSEGKKFFNDNLPIELEVVNYNDRAINFYKKLGFIMTDKVPKPGPVMPISKIMLPTKVMSMSAIIKE
jgi:GNAT superfamily N-acetyltransferase